MENSVFLYPNVKSSSKYAFTVMPTHNTSMAWTCSRALPDDATSPKQCQWHSQSYIWLYIHYDLTWARNIRVFCLETQPFPGAFILTDCLQILEHRVHLNTEWLQKRHAFLTAFSLPFLFIIFSPPFPLRNSSILLKGSLTSLKYHSDTSKCLQKGPVLLFTYNSCNYNSHLSAFKSLSHFLISNYQIFQWNNLFLSSVHY